MNTNISAIHSPQQSSLSEFENSSIAINLNDNPRCSVFKPSTPHNNTEEETNPPRNKSVSTPPPHPPRPPRSLPLSLPSSLIGTNIEDDSFRFQQQWPFASPSSCHEFPSSYPSNHNFINNTDTSDGEGFFLQLPTQSREYYFTSQESNVERRLSNNDNNITTIEHSNHTFNRSNSSHNTNSRFNHRSRRPFVLKPRVQEQRESGIWSHRLVSFKIHALEIDSDTHKNMVFTSFS